MRSPVACCRQTVIGPAAEGPKPLRGKWGVHAPLALSVSATIGPKAASPPGPKSKLTPGSLSEKREGEKGKSN